MEGELQHGPSGPLLLPCWLLQQQARIAQDYQELPSEYVASNGPADKSATKSASSNRVRRLGSWKRAGREIVWLYLCREQVVRISPVNRRITGGTRQIIRCTRGKMECDWFSGTK